MTPIITAFEKSPDGGRGLARDFPVRWAFEEVGQPYDVRLLPWAEMKQPAHLALQPFGQIPTFEEDDLAMFESGAIILHIAEQHPGLLPDDPDARARAICWMFAAKATVEPVIVENEVAKFLEGDKSWSAERQPMIDGRIRDRLRQLSARLGDAEWLDDRFSAGDLLMINVLRRPSGRAIAEEFANLAAYIARGEARPAFKRAFEAQKAVFAAAEAAD